MRYDVAGLTAKSNLPLITPSGKVGHKEIGSFSAPQRVLALALCEAQPEGMYGPHDTQTPHRIHHDCGARRVNGRGEVDQPPCPGCSVGCIHVHDNTSLLCCQDVTERR